MCGSQFYCLYRQVAGVPSVTHTFAKAGGAGDNSHVDGGGHVALNRGDEAAGGGDVGAVAGDAHGGGDALELRGPPRRGHVVRGEAVEQNRKHEAALYLHAPAVRKHTHDHDHAFR